MNVVSTSPGDGHQCSVLDFTAPQAQTQMRAQFLADVKEIDEALLLQVHDMKGLEEGKAAIEEEFCLFRIRGHLQNLYSGPSVPENVKESALVPEDLKNKVMKIVL